MIRPINDRIQNNYLIRKVNSKQLGGGTKEQFKDLLQQQNERIKERLTPSNEEHSFQMEIVLAAQQHIAAYRKAVLFN